MKVTTPRGLLVAAVLTLACDAPDRTTAVTESRQIARIDTLNVFDTVEPLPAAVDVPPPIEYQGYTIADISGGAWSVANDINDFGAVVGSYMRSGRQHGFVRYHDGSFEDIPPFPGDVSSEATGINNAHVVVGISTSHSGVSTGWFKYPNQTPIPMNATLCQGRMTTSAIDGVGEIVGSCDGHPTFWPYHTAVAPPIPVGGAFLGVSLGSSVGYGIFTPNGPRVAFGRNSHGLLFTVGMPPGTTSSSLTGINGSGEMVGVFVRAGAEHGFVTTLTSGRLLAHAAWGISDKGRVVGWFLGLPGVAYTIAPNASFETALPPLNVSRAAVRVNRCGSIVGQYFPLGLAAGPRAALWTKAQCD